MQASVSFKWSELECKCGCKTRYPLHNVRVGGSPKSQHRATKQSPSTAFDISLKGLHKKDVIKAAKAAGFKGLGINYKSFVHIDNRKYSATW